MEKKLDPREYDSRKEFYLEYLKTEHWNSLRTRALDHYGRQCENCGLRQMELQVHHLFYRNLYSVTLQDLLVLCFSCHEKVHELLDSRLLLYLKTDSRKFRRQCTLNALKGKFSSIEHHKKTQQKVTKKKLRKLKRPPKIKGKTFQKPRIIWDKESEAERHARYQKARI